MTIDKQWALEVPDFEHKIVMKPYMAPAPRRWFQTWKAWELADEFWWNHWPRNCNPFQKLCIFFKWETHGTNPWSLSKSTDYSEIHWFWFRQSPRRIFFPRFWKHRLFGPGALYDGTGARESLGGPGGPGAPQFPCELRLCQLPVLRTAWHKLVVLWLSILRRWKLPRQRVGVSARR